MREEFSFESTQLMIGTYTLDEAVSKMIALVCTDLGWECGMYWSMASTGSEAGRLVLSHYWSGEERPLSDVVAQTGGDRLSIAPREGLVGAVWSWASRAGSKTSPPIPISCTRPSGQAGIHSGFAFPVAYDDEDGRRHRPGVLEFFCCLSRQRDAQLPSFRQRSAA